MYVPYDERRGIHPQDDELPRPRGLGPRRTRPREQFPLLLHYHPLVIYRYQVIKQADIVLAMFLLGDEFTPEQKRRNFDYYDPLTTGDSSLSACVQSIVAAEVGYERRGARVLPLRAADGPRRRRRQRRRRRPHRLDRRGLDGAGLRLRRACATTTASSRSTRACRRRGALWSSRCASTTASCEVELTHDGDVLHLTEGEALTIEVRGKRPRTAPGGDR